MIFFNPDKVSVCLSVVSYARPHLWADPNESLQGDLGGPSDGHGGSDVEPFPWGPWGGWQNFKKAVKVTTMELLRFLCHRKDNNYAYTSATECMQKC